MPHSIFRTTRSIYRRMMGRIRRARLRGPKLMRAFAEAFPTAQIVQIGSNDGEKHDPIHLAVTSNDWRGVLVEPVPYVFRRLQTNYAAYPALHLENVAIAPQSGEMTFYYLEQATGDEALPTWYDELGSFNKDVILKHADRIPDLAKRISSMPVPCLSFDELCRRNNIDDVNLLHIDTEGFDFEIIRSIDFTQHRPCLLIFEHKHLSAADRQDCLKLLDSAGYSCFSERFDTWCALRESPDARHAAFIGSWNRLAK